MTLPYVDTFDHEIIPYIQHGSKTLGEHLLVHAEDLGVARGLTHVSLGPSSAK